MGEGAEGAMGYGVFGEGSIPNRQMQPFQAWYTVDCVLGVHVQRQ